MKTYFTKYLPVEGEIKEGDKVFNTFGEIVVTSDGHKYIKEWKLAKLFLCSRDIQIGDKVEISDSLSKYWDLESENDVRIAKDKGFYKVIGEVSPEATWITEGMEFDRNDFQMIWSNGKQRKLSRYDLRDVEIEPILIAEFKCPTCKQFH